MRNRKTILATAALAALLGIAPAAQADGRNERSHWARGHEHRPLRHESRHEYRHERRHERRHEWARRDAYRHGYRDGHRDHRLHRGWYGGPRYYGPSGYGFNVWMDGVGVSWYESDRWCD
jgi:hypothetical protein